MMKFAVVSAFLVLSSRQVQSGTLSGGFSGFSGGGDDSYGGGSFTGFSLPSVHSIPSAPAPAPAPAPSIPDLGSGGLDPSLIQSGGDGGDFSGGVSIVGGGGPSQGQTLDLTHHAGNDHSGKIFGGSFISASDGGKSGSYGSDEDGGGDSSSSYDIHGLAALAAGGGLGSYSGASSYDVGHGGGDSGEISSVLSSSYGGHDLGGAGGHWGYH